MVKGRDAGIGCEQIRYGIVGCSGRKSRESQGSQDIVQSCGIKNMYRRVRREVEWREGTVVIENQRWLSGMEGHYPNEHSID